MCNNPSCPLYNCSLYTKIRECGGFENWAMIQIELFSCDNKREKEQREREWIEELKPTLNKVKCLNKTIEDQRQWDREYEKKQARIDYVRNYWKGKKKTCPHCQKDIDAKSISTHIKKWCKHKPEDII